MMKNHHAGFLFCFCHSLLMDLGQDQQQHPPVHSGELVGSPVAHLPLFCRSTSAPLPLTFRSPSAWKLGNLKPRKLSSFNRFQPFSTVFYSLQPFLTISAGFSGEIKCVPYAVFSKQSIFKAKHFFCKISVFNN